MTPNENICNLCGKKGARAKKISQSYGRGAGEYLVRNIPMISCPHCCESYLTAETLHELEHIKTHHRRLAVRRAFAVADFPRKSRRRAS